jgi:hypothetical protein
MSEKIADCINWMETMLDKSYNNPIQYTYELMLGILVLPKIKDPEFRKLLKHYNLLWDSVGEAVKENQQDLLLIPANLDRMTQTLPLQEEILWREARKFVTPWDLGAAFTNFAGDCQEWSIAQVQGLPTESTPLPMDAPRSGSVGGGERKPAQCQYKKARGFRGVPLPETTLQEFVGAAAQANVQWILVRETTPARAPRVLQSSRAPAIQPSRVSPQASPYGSHDTLPRKIP